MNIPFVKYHGAGNDFVMVDQRQQQWIGRTDRALVAAICHRRFGVGADGLILLQHHPEQGYEMVYFNSDGGESTLCGNGGRCFVAFARHLGIVEGDQWSFLAIDGPHDATVRTHPDGAQGHEWVELHMRDIDTIEQLGDQTFVLNTGSPHYIAFEQNIGQKDIYTAGKAIRYSEQFAPGGLNVNFVEEMPSGGLRIRTYERGVEDETLACGTGVTAAAIAWAYREGRTGHLEVPVQAEGGHLSVRMDAKAGQFSGVWLCGPAQRVFEGEFA
jgi:diaminopimelate epimerase